VIGYSESGRRKISLLRSCLSIVPAIYRHFAAMRLSALSDSDKSCSIGPADRLKFQLV